MRARLLVLSTIALCLPLIGCPKKGSGGAGADSGVATTPASDTAAAAKPPPPADGATSCTITLTGKKADSGKDPGLEFKMKNSGSRALRFCQIYLFGYDKSGNVAGKGGLSENHELKPGEEFTGSFGLTATDDKNASIINTPGLTFVTVVPHVIFTDNSEWEDSKFDYSKGPGPQGAAAAASASAAPTATAPAATGAATAAHPTPTARPGGRPAPPPPPARR